VIRAALTPPRAPRQDPDDPIRFSNETCGVSGARRAMPAHAPAPAPAAPQAVPAPPPLPRGPPLGSSPRAESPPPEPVPKRARTASARMGAARAAPAAPAAPAARKEATGAGAERPAGGEAAPPAAAGAAPPREGGGAAAPAPAPRVNPIDHIFQFHKALRRDLRSLEAEARAFAAALDEAAAWAGGGPALQALEGRYRFLWGIYCAHSEAEDAIVFPALEAKEALRHVSHAYTLDHQQEAQLFEEMAAVLRRVAGAGSLADARAAAAALARLTAATRASLEQHVRAEEQELWPLFAENFTEAEQQHLVGVIVGRTGAEVLQAMLPWVTGSCTAAEQAAMMASLRSATRNTGFERWLGATLPPPPGAAQGAPGGGPAGAPAAAAPAAALPHLALDDVADYLRGGAGAGAGGGASAGSDSGDGGGGGGGGGAAGAEAGVFRPGWEDIFRMNQQQLEARPAPEGIVACSPILRGGAVQAWPKERPCKLRHSLHERRQPARMSATCRRAQRAHASVQSARRACGSTAWSAGAAPTPFRAGPPLQPRAQPSLRSSPGPTRRWRRAGAQETARRVCGDAGLAAERKAYLMQNIMASRYIVAQQRRLAGAGAAGDGPGGGPARTYHDAARGVLGCAHYQRRCHVVAPCCGQVHACRFCHDEVADHRLDPHAVTAMVCMACSARQPAAAACRACGEPMARYYCGICHLWDDEPARAIYHCPFCNLCRRGRGLGVDACHCMDCNSCMHLSEFARHKCRDLSACPVCTDYLFDSAQPYRARRPPPPPVARPHRPPLVPPAALRCLAAAARPRLAVLVHAEHGSLPVACCTLPAQAATCEYYVRARAPPCGDAAERRRTARGIARPTARARARAGAAVRALHALALLRAVHALPLRVPRVRQEPGRHERLLPHARLAARARRGRAAARVRRAPPGAPPPRHRCRVGYRAGSGAQVRRAGRAAGVG